MLRLATRMFSYLMASTMARVFERVGKVYCSNSFKIFHAKSLVSGALLFAEGIEIIFSYHQIHFIDPMISPVEFLTGLFFIFSI